jgi:hypothetical protein
MMGYIVAMMGGNLVPKKRTEDAVNLMQIYPFVATMVRAIKTGGPFGLWASSGRAKNPG